MAWWVAAAQLMAKATYKNRVARGIRNAGRWGFAKRIDPHTGESYRRVPQSYNKFKQGVYELGWAMEALTGMGDKWLSRVIKSVQVRVTGSTSSTLQELFYLAVAIASSRLRKFVAVGAVGDEWTGVYDHVLFCQLDFTSKVVHVEMAISIGGAVGELTKGDALRDIKTPPPQIITAINQWPNFLKTDDKFDFKLTKTGGTETMLIEGAGRNPFPDGDGVSRTSTELTALVAAALVPACAAPTKPTTVTYVGGPRLGGSIPSLKLPTPGGNVVPQ